MDVSGKSCLSTHRQPFVLTTALQIHPKFQTPVNAVFVTAGFSFSLSLIYIGSPTAFYAITSLMTVALLQCYMFSIGSILWRRVRMPETIPKSHFCLGRWGIPINAVAFVWCMWAFVSLLQLLGVISKSLFLTVHDKSGPLGLSTLRCRQAISTGRQPSLWESSGLRSFTTTYTGTKCIRVL